MLGEQAVEVLEEVIAVVGVVLPGVFAVEDDADHRRASSFGRAIEDGFQLRDQMLGGIAAVPFGIVEADQVGQALVAEKQGQPGACSSFQGW
jgi:hypothetical protein